MHITSNTQANMTYREYLGDLIGGSLMLKESQTIAILLLKKPTQGEWDDAIINQNILQKRSDASAKRNASTIKKRLAGLPEEFLEGIAYGTTLLSSQLMFAATLINSPLLRDFMKHSVQDAARMFRESIDISDWESFWEERCRLFPELGEMTESSTYKIAQVAFKTIADAGYIESTRTKRIQNVIVLPEVKDLLISMSKDDVIAAMEFY